MPADLVEGCEFVTSGSAARGQRARGERTARMSRRRSRAIGPRPRPGAADRRGRSGPARRRFESAFDTFRQLFPPALCYAKIVPVDEAVTLTLFYREDDHLRRLMLDDAQAARLDRLWGELRFVSQDALDARRRLPAAPGVCLAGRRPEGVRAPPQADPGPRRGLPQVARRGRAEAARRRDRVRREGVPPPARPGGGRRTARPSTASSAARSCRTTTPGG